MFEKLKAALLTVEPKVGHYKGFKNEDRYIVWSEDNEADAIWADGEMIGQVIEGTIHYFLKGEDDTAIFRMQKALDDIGLSYRYNLTIYEPDTGFIHHEWIWQIEV